MSPHFNLRCEGTTITSVSLASERPDRRLKCGKHTGLDPDLLHAAKIESA